MEAKLTTREKQILEMSSNDLLVKQIASELHIADSTVYTHQKRIETKLGVHTMGAAFKRACQLNLVNLF